MLELEDPQPYLNNRGFEPGASCAGFSTPATFGQVTLLRIRF